MAKKPNAKGGDDVKIIQAGPFYLLEGKVVSVGQSDKPVKVDLAPYGTWCFPFSGVEQKEKKK